jgi:HK97 family phage major capsid protein
VKLTAQLKAFLVAKGWCQAGDSDEKFKAAISAHILKGDLTASQLAELSKEVAPTGGQKLADLIQTQLNATLAPLLTALKGAGVTVEVPTGNGTGTGTGTGGGGTGGGSGGSNPDKSTPTEEAVAAAVRKQFEQLGIPIPETGAVQGGMTGLLSRSAEILGRPNVRVKQAVESYSTTRKGAVYPERCGINGSGSKHLLAGRPAQVGGVSLDLPSDRDKAISAAYFKFALTRSNRPEEIPNKLRMTDHDKDLLQWSIRNSQWTGYLKSNPADELDPSTSEEIRVDRRKLSEFEQKALLDDSTSGGIEIAPIEFDDALVTTPVLFGEFFPMVSVTNITRGRRVKGGAVTNPTFTSGVAEGTAITPYNTSAFVSAFDTTVYTAVAALEIGLDFEEDSPTNIGQIIIQKYGEKALEWLDMVITIGDGLTQPQGFFNSSGAIVVSTDFNTVGPPTVGDYEALMFGVQKQFRTTKGSRNIFAGSDVSYRRARGIPVGPGDERRVMGMDHGSYTLLEHPYKVNNLIPNNKIAFVNLGYYRMYRRLGMNVRIETQGQALALKNTKLIVVRMRYGGQLELGGAAAVATNGMN